MERVGLLGHPVAHSLSPRLHAAAFAALGLDWRYELLDVPAGELPAAFARLRAEGWRGCNVTLPHKQAVLPLLSDLSPVSRRAGAVNTVVATDDGWYGDNTDVAGFGRALAAAGWQTPTAGVGEALLLGAGGAARAALVHLLELGGPVTIVNRTPDRALALAAEFAPLAAERGAQVTALTSAAVPVAVAARCSLVVQATSSGRHTDQWLPLTVAATPTTALFCDLNYDLTGPTPFCHAAAAAGRLTVDGLRMLVEQAAVAFSRWTGRPAPLAAMLAAVARPGKEQWT